jgi:hypothetical protein
MSQCRYVVKVKFTQDHPKNAYYFHSYDLVCPMPVLGMKPKAVSAIFSSTTILWTSSR